MKYIKEYYNVDDYKNILNHLFRIFIDDNFINISYEYEIINEIINDICFDILNKNIKSDKKLFKVVREKCIELINNKIIVIDEIYEKSLFKSNEHMVNNRINYNYFHLEIKDEIKRSC